jgi:hypothetical protein
MRREEVNTLLTQAAWQIGPLSDCSSCRVWHEELQTSQFGRQLLETCHRVLENIKENWLESVTLRTLSEHLDLSGGCILNSSLLKSHLSFVSWHRYLRKDIAFAKLPWPSYNLHVLLPSNG